MGALLPASIGFGLAAAAGMMAHVSGLDRDRAFYPTVLVVIASYYGLFAVMGGSGSDLIAESLAFALFAAAALLGFRYGLWIVVAGLAAHGVFDLMHHFVIADPGVPAWWPIFCLCYDLAAAAGLALLIRRQNSRRWADSVSPASAPTG